MVGVSDLKCWIELSNDVVGMNEDCIEMTCHLRYCPQCQGDPLSLLSVLGCNFYDDHETEHHHEPANESSDENETQTLSM